MRLNERVDLNVEKFAEYVLEALILGWFVYLFAYQNYLLYNWHRGLRLPSRAPSLLIGILSAALFLFYGFRRSVVVKREEPTPPVAQRTGVIKEHVGELDEFDEPEDFIPERKEKVDIDEL